MAVVRYSFSLDPIKDAHLVRWLKLQPNTSHAVRGALQAFIRRPTHADLETKLDQVLEVLRGVQVIAPGAVPAGDAEGEPARAVKGLDAMVHKFRG